MPLPAIPTKARKDPLGHQLLSQLAANIAQLRDGPGHTALGVHNDWDVPRVVGSFSVAAGPSYTIAAGSSAFIESVSYNGVGDVTVNFTAGKVVTAGVKVRPRIAFGGTSGPMKPYMATYEAAASDSIRLHFFELADALGAGNTWAAVDADFALSVNSPPCSGGWRRDLLVPHHGNNLAANAETLGMLTGNWNQYVQNIGQTRTNLVAEHLSTGVHNCREVARDFGRAEWGGIGTGYSFLDCTGGVAGTLTRVSQGRIQVDLSGYSNPYQVFPIVGFNHHPAVGDPSYTHSSADSVMFVVTTSAHHDGYFLLNIYGYDFDAGTWGREDADFSFVLHRAPA